MEKGDGERKQEGCERSGVDMDREEKDLFREPPLLNLNKIKFTILHMMK